MMHPIDQYIADENAKINARAKAEGWQFWTNLAYTAEFLAKNYGIQTLEQYLSWRDEQDALEQAKEDRKNSYGW